MGLISRHGDKSLSSNLLTSVSNSGVTILWVNARHCATDVCLTADAYEGKLSIAARIRTDNGCATSRYLACRPTFSKSISAAARACRVLTGSFFKICSRSRVGLRRCDMVAVWGCSFDSDAENKIGKKADAEVRPTFSGQHRHHDGQDARNAGWSDPSSTENSTGIISFVVTLPFKSFSTTTSCWAPSKPTGIMIFGMDRTTYDAAAPGEAKDAWQAQLPPSDRKRH